MGTVGFFDLRNRDKYTQPVLLSILKYTQDLELPSKTWVSMLALGFFDLRKRDVPVIVPPVPTPPRNTSTLPSVCREVKDGLEEAELAALYPSTSASRGTSC